ncbi:MAG: tryptophan-rich sensory protein [Syntrophomonadaceae bacterium]|jgi:tryptophan-rich sensory protein|nr:tryptophan-rich sensory protein [Syntrophomonadaceae bacterium]MDH7497562.1 tryptophan-rich sensory protein [Syntrophomonadaceae bacterium]
MKVGEVFLLALCILGCELVGLVGARFTAPAISGWYEPLLKPWFAPPQWLFGPVWITLYAMMGSAAFLLWRQGIHRHAVAVALTWFAVQLVLNALWSPAFFGLRSPLAGLVVIVPLWLAILATIWASLRVSTAAALLLVPYLAWVSLAMALNYSIWRLNR